MSLTKYIFFTVLASIVCIGITYGQAENVPTANPVYDFFKRMEIKGAIESYNDAVLPLSRNQTARLLLEIHRHERTLTEIERARLADFFIEFKQDIVTEFKRTGATIPEFDTEESANPEAFEVAEKHLYTYSDSLATLTIDGLLSLETRRTEGDSQGSKHAEFIQFGGRIRGTLYDRVGYYIQGTNAQFWGQREVLQRDKYISQAYTLGIQDAQNFDIIEGYMRYDGGIISAQVGRERIVWGTGYGDKMIVSDNVRMFDAVRLDAEYKSFRYTFLHGWLLGKKTLETFGTVTEPVVADKYIGAHRLQIAFPHITLGFQEMAIYSNRSVDLAYLNPITLIESAQRSREERDNVLWAFDCKANVLNMIEVQGTLLFDDLNFPKIGTSSYQNKFAMQIGAMAVDPAGIPNTSLAIEYTRVNPYTFSHERSRDNDYGSFYRILSHHIGPNSDSWFFRIDAEPLHRLTASFRLELQREGENIYSSTGDLLFNAGGDFLVPHRDSDPQEEEFLAGIKVHTTIGQVFATYEIINQFFFDMRYQYTYRNIESGTMTATDHDFGLGFRIDY